MGCVKGEGGSSNVHVVLKGGSSKCSCPFTRGREGVKIVPNPVHVVCECPLWKFLTKYDICHMVGY